MKMVNLCLKIVESAYMLFFTGETINNTKSMCLTHYAIPLNDTMNFEKAIRFYNKAIRMNIDNRYAYRGLASCQVERKVFGDALKT